MKLESTVGTNKKVGNAYILLFSIVGQVMARSIDNFDQFQE